MGHAEKSIAQPKITRMVKNHKQSQIDHNLAKSAGTRGEAKKASRQCQAGWYEARYDPKTSKRLMAKDYLWRSSFWWVDALRVSKPTVPCQMSYVCTTNHQQTQQSTKITALEIRLPSTQPRTPPTASWMSSRAAQSAVRGSTTKVSGQNQFTNSITRRPTSRNV